MKARAEMQPGRLGSRVGRLLVALLFACASIVHADAAETPIQISDEARIDIQSLRMADSLPDRVSAKAAETTSTATAPADGPWWRRLTGGNGETRTEEVAAPKADVDRQTPTDAKFTEADTGTDSSGADPYVRQVSGGFELLKVLALVGITFVCILFIWEWLRGRSVGNYQEVALAGGAGRARVSVPQNAPRRVPRVPANGAARRVPAARPVRKPPRSVQKAEEPASNKPESGWAEEAFAEADKQAAAKAARGKKGSEDWDSWLNAGSVGWGGYNTAESYDPEADDPLAAANLYMSFGLHDQATSLLLEKIAAFPKRGDLRVALLQAYYSVNNHRAFKRHFKDLLGTNLKVKDSAWADISHWGSDLMPEEPVFRAENLQQARDVYGQSI